jgi:hypothetical protein
MIVRNSKTGVVLTITQDTWEKWSKVNLQRNWRIIISDPVPVVKYTNIINEFLDNKKKEEVVELVEKPIKRKYERRKNAFERTSKNAEQI